MEMNHSQVHEFFNGFQSDCRIIEYFRFFRNFVEILLLFETVQFDCT